MPKNRITDLRNHLFETLEALKDKDEPMELDRARAIADVARVVIDSAKVEVDVMRVTDAIRCTDFFPEDNAERPKLAEAPARRRA